jgi:galactose mutarotase-like enzyme
LNFQEDSNDPDHRQTIAGFPDLAIWPTETKPFVCLEPWFGIPNIDPANRDPRRRPGAIELAPGAVFRAASRIAV